MTKKSLNVPFLIIISLGAIAYSISLLKYIFLNETLPAIYYIFEFSSYLIFLFILYFSDFQSIIKNRKIKDLDLEIKDLKKYYEARESKYLLRILDLEAKEKEELHFDQRRRKILSNLFASIPVTKNTKDKLKHFLHTLSNNFEINLAIFYIVSDMKTSFNPIQTFGIESIESILSFSPGEGFCGQVALDQVPFLLEDIPQEYHSIVSGLGNQIPKHIYFLPVIKDSNTIGLVEIGTFKTIDIIKMWPEINNNLIDLLT